MEERPKLCCTMCITFQNCDIICLAYSIDLGTYYQALKMHPKTNRSTLIKYLHGWLETHDRQQKVCRLTETTCPLCGDTDTNFHMFYCSDPQLKQKRNGFWEGELCRS